MLPKRFPDREEVSAVRAAAEKAENGETLDDELRVAGRVMARREMGKLTFLDLVDRSGRIQLISEQQLDLDLGDIVGASGRPGRSRRGEPSLVTSRSSCWQRTAARCRTRFTASPTSRRATASGTSTCSSTTRRAPSSSCARGS